MSFSVVTNVASLNAQANMARTELGLGSALNRLSSGLRINSSGDDAAGLVVANGHRSDATVLSQGIRNANDGLSTLQIMDSALDNVSQILDRMATLAAQSASTVTSDASRTILQAEFSALRTELDRQTSVASLDANYSYAVFVSNDGADGEVAGTITGVTSTTLGINASTIAAQADAETAVAAVRAAVGTLGTSQGQIGTLQNQTQFAINLAQSQYTNTKAAESRIRDANVAEEAANMTRFNILTQSGVAALAQANSASSAVLGLLR